MPVPNKMADLATLASSNFPTGTESIGNSLDDYIRSVSAILRSTNAIASSTIASASTTDISNADAEYVIITGTSTINSFGAGFAGCRRELRFSSALTITQSSNILTPGGINLSVAAGDVIDLRCTASGVWVVAAGSKDYGAVRRTGDNMSGGLAITFVGDFLKSITGVRTYNFFNDGAGIFGVFDAFNSRYAYLYDGTGAGKVTMTGQLFVTGADAQLPITCPSTTKAIRHTVNQFGSGGAVGTYSIQRALPSGGYDGVDLLSINLSTNAASVAGTFNAGGDITSAGNLISNSDIRLKKNIETIRNASEVLRKIRGVRYDKDGKRQIGLVADELLNSAPELVSVPDDPKQMKGVAYAQGVGLLVQGWNDLDARLARLERMGGIHGVA